MLFCSALLYTSLSKSLITRSTGARKKAMVKLPADTPALTLLLAASELRWWPCGDHVIERGATYLLKIEIENLFIFNTAVEAVNSQKSYFRSSL